MANPYKGGGPECGTSTKGPTSPPFFGFNPPAGPMLLRAQPLMVQPNDTCCSSDTCCSPSPTSCCGGGPPSPSGLNLN
jgi:hypothetical protein